MKHLRRLALFAALSSWLAISCSTRVPPAAIAWTDNAAVLAPTASAPAGFEGMNGALRVETDTDVRVNGSLGYDNVRRPFDLYAPDGTLIRADVDNRGARSGEEPVSLSLPAGRYVVASVYGTTYRKVQVEVRAGTTTEVSSSTLREAPPVFAH